MIKPRRKVLFCDNAGRLIFDTDFHGPWTLTEQSLSAPERKTNIIDIPGRDGEMDIASALTSGEPRYKNRELELRFECSEGSKEQRTALIFDMTSRINGRYCQVILPDHPLQFLAGYMELQPDYNDPSHSSVIIRSSVAPYFTAINSTKFDLEAAATMESVIIRNGGGKKVVPAVSAYATAPDMPNITMRCGSFTTTITDYATHFYDELAMRYDEAKAIRYMGSGHLVITWREAYL